MGMQSQHMAALSRANEVRLWLVERKREVKSGQVGVWVDLAQSHDVRLRSVTLLEFIMWLPGVGKSRARSLIVEQFDWPTSRVELQSVSRLDRETAVWLCAVARERCLRVAT